MASADQCPERFGAERLGRGVALGGQHVALAGGPRSRWGGYFVSFLPAISAKAAKAIRRTIRDWRMASTRNNQKLEDLARLSNPAVRGWMNYYGRFYRSKCVQVLRHLNKALARWARRKYRRFRRRERASMYWLGRIARREHETPPPQKTPRRWPRPPNIHPGRPRQASTIAPCTSCPASTRTPPAATSSPACGKSH